MNLLSYKITEFEGSHWVHLVVDGKPLEEIVGGETGGLHSSYFEPDDFPHLPPRSGHWDGETYMVSHCECGEYGCGNTHCRFRILGDKVIMDRFQTGKESEGTTVLEFDKTNFDAVKDAVLRTLQNKMQNKSAHSYP
ncbi:MAG: hypothetical protein AAGA58_02325 [Verrucomicrobiota bacterium]